MVGGTWSAPAVDSGAVVADVRVRTESGVIVGVDTIGEVRTGADWATVVVSSFFTSGTLDATGSLDSTCNGGGAVASNGVFTEAGLEEGASPTADCDTDGSCETNDAAADRAGAESEGFAVVD